MVAAPKPPDNGRPKQHSFAQILNVSKPNPRSIIQPIEISIPESFVKSNPSMVKGEPVFLLSKEEDEKLAAPFKFSLVGKFSRGRPKTEYLWNRFNAIGFVWRWISFMNCQSGFLLGTEEYSYYQYVTYENLLEYCMECCKIGHSSQNCRHGKPKDESAKEKERKVMMPLKPMTRVILVSQPETKANSVSQPTMGKAKFQPVTKQSKQAEGNKEVTETSNPNHTKESVIQQEIKQNKEESSSGLSELEKTNIPTDIRDSSPIESGDKRQLTKEKLSAILEKSLEEENLQDTWEEVDVVSTHGNENRQLTVYKKPPFSVYPLNLSSRFDLLTDMPEDQQEDITVDQEKVRIHLDGEISSESKTEMYDSDERVNISSHLVITRDDQEVGKQDSNMEVARLVVSDGEEQKKKRGRPRGSTKMVRTYGKETRRSTRLQGDTPTKVSQ
ncbi:OLC1v1005628C1 [Oldenlandia corymbosa var. corymbosa]|uniref:OLC1v1005628C1 n=1 Tax=Oldenlandia corymbosa var. corymbosa TaxID=529605 RepID=A0AAV1DIH6_OLDCO|nr:OLC1v1005628C1 [Oldenlandia corymbosa var. corymbosa]